TRKLLHEAANEIPVADRIDITSIAQLRQDRIVNEPSVGKRLFCRSETHSCRSICGSHESNARLWVEISNPARDKHGLVEAFNTQTLRTQEVAIGLRRGTIFE